MEQKQENTTTPPGRLMAMIMIGFGFLAIGIAFLLLMNQSSAFASTQDFSTVPAQVDYPAPELTLTTLGGDRESCSAKVFLKLSRIRVARGTQRERKTSR